MKKLALQPAFLWGRPAKQRTEIPKKEEPPRGEDVSETVRFAQTFCNKTAVVTIISDDGDFETGKTLNTLTKEYDLPATVAGTATNVGLHEDWWRNTLQENQLLELVSHSYNHARMSETDRIAGSKAWLRHEIAHSIRFFERRFGEKQIAFVCPENEMCALGYEVLRESGIIAVRRGERGNNAIYPAAGQEPGAWYHLRSRGIMDHTGDDAEALRREEVQSAIRDRAWLIEMWHNVRGKADGAYQTILLPDAKTHLAYLKSLSDDGELWVGRFTDVVKYAVELEHAQLIAKRDGDTLCMYAAVDVDRPEVYDHPLTVCFQAPAGYTIAGSKEVHSDKDSYWVNVRPNTAVRVPLKQL
ncbi:MAG: polysaccharide deacetylase family protein [Clostridia bacterium]|nr:polysaccharide deacetylase family protein [Clostridia bacterium]